MVEWKDRESSESIAFEDRPDIIFEDTESSLSISFLVSSSSSYSSRSSSSSSSVVVLPASSSSSYSSSRSSSSSSPIPELDFFVDTTHDRWISDEYFMWWKGVILLPPTGLKIIP